MTYDTIPARAYPAVRLDVGLPCIMGVLNTTPDSFSDGGLYLELGEAVEHALQMARDGATIIDIGGESTRPGSDPVALDDELRRTIPVVEQLAAAVPALISVDTTKAEVARRALDAGARLVNDVSALRFDPALTDLVAERGCPVCIMHMKGLPKTMQDDPVYHDVVDDVCAFLEERLHFAVSRGIAEDQIIVDPGIGFGKTAEHNLQLLRRLDRVAALGRPVLLGTSRKRFLGAVLGVGPRERVIGTVATTTMGVLLGAAILRVHDVRPNFEALRVTQAVLEAGP